MDDLAPRRRFFAEEIEAVASLTTPALVEALATVPREAFLPPGPWVVRGEGDIGAAPRRTPDANPACVYHNLSIAIDPARQLFNGGPGIVASTIDALALRSGARVLHVGCGFGYYTAILAHIVGPTGRVDALEVDAALADEARARLQAMPCVHVAHGDGSAGVPHELDAILVSAGLTHVPDAWLDALAADGRIVLPLTATLPPMGPLGKGPMLLLTRVSDGSFAVRRIAPVIAAYSAVGLRDAVLDAALGQAMARAPFAVPRRLRRDPHEPTADCWLHAPTFCFSLA